MEKIYKKDTSGKIRWWQGIAEDGHIIEKSGLIDGKEVVHKKQAKPKNIGKSNETTAIEQAKLEILAKYQLKLSKDYFKTIEEAETTKVLLPMLAKEYDKVKNKIQFPCYVQPKLDGIRCTTRGFTMRSRENNIVETMQHIVDDLKANNINIPLDGELYAHGLSFQENMKIIKKKRAGTLNVKYHVYDIPSESDFDFKTRYDKLKHCIERSHLRTVELVPTYVVFDMEEVKKYHTMFLAQGYEGTIIRWGDSAYKFNGRSDNLVKYKDFKDAALTILDIIPSDANPKHGKVVCAMNGVKFPASAKMSYSDREDLLLNKDKYIGKTAEIRYFDTFESGVPRFPVFAGFRD